MDTSGDISHFYSCECEDGCIGENCGTNIDECATDPCQNDAACRDGIADYTCNCLYGWQGKNCHDKVNACELGLDDCNADAV